jgi:putative phage-type endonuclease
MRTLDDNAARAAWLQERRGGIGGSDAAPAAGFSKWKSRFQLWCEKTGKVPETDLLEEKEFVRWGSILEEPIAQRYVEITGRRLVDRGRFAIRRHPERPWMHCTIDREIPFIADQSYLAMPPMPSPGDLSIKNTNEFAKKDWEDEPPIPYQIQLQHELAVTGMQWGSFAVLIGGNKFLWKDVPRNDRFIAMLLEVEEEFWDYVRRDEPPPVDGSSQTREVLSRLYPKDSGESCDLPAEAEGWLASRAQLTAAMKRTREELDAVENNIKAALKEASIGLLDGVPAVSWKRQHRSGYAVPATDCRILRSLKA